MYPNSVLVLILQIILHRSTLHLPWT